MKLFGKIITILGLITAYGLLTGKNLDVLFVDIWDAVYPMAINIADRAYEFYESVKSAER